MTMTFKKLSDNKIFLFDVVAFAMLFLLYVYFTHFHDPQWLSNSGVLRWASTDNRALVYIYVAAFLYFVPRLILLNLLNDGLDFDFSFSRTSLLGIDSPLWLKIPMLLVFSYLCVVGVFLPAFNDGYGSSHVATSMNSHLLVSLAPLSQAVEHGKTVYLDTPTQYAPGTLYLLSSIDHFMAFTSADAYRFQLLVNLGISLLFISVLILFTGPVIGGIVSATLFLPFGIFENFDFPGWGLMHRWMLMPMIGIFLVKTLVKKYDTIYSPYFRLSALAVIWSISAFISQETFGGGIIAYSLIFLLVMKYQTSPLNEYISKYLVFLGVFLAGFFTIPASLYGVDELGNFFSMYTEFSGRVFSGATSTFLTDTIKLSQNPAGMIYTAIIYFGIIVLLASVYLVLSAKRDEIPQQDIAMFAAILACAIASNLISYFRSDIIHIRSSAILMLPVFILFLIFYVGWFKNRNPALNLVAFFTLLLVMSAGWHSKVDLAETANRSLAKPAYGNVYDWLNGTVPNEQPDLSSFDIQPTDKQRVAAYNFVLNKFSRIPSEQHFAIENFRDDIIRAAELRLALSGKAMLPYLPGVRRPERILFLSGIKSPTRVTSQIVSIWTIEDKKKWLREAQSAINFCVSMDIPNYGYWLGQDASKAETRQIIDLGDRVKGRSTRFACI